MAVSLKHTTQAVGTDAGTGEIRKAQWNEEHSLQLATGKLLGRTTAGTGAAEEIGVTSGLALSGGTLSNLNNKIQALGSITGATSVNLANGQIATATCTGAVTWSFTGLITGECNTVTLHLTNPGAGTQTWPTGTTFDRNVAPTLSAAGKTTIMFETYDNGTTWCASQVWRNTA